MAATADRPNVLLITTDQQRWDALGLNDPATDLRTPIMDQLAASGVNFTRAYSTCPVCIPARRSLLTGLHPDTHGLRGYRDGLEWSPPFTLPGLMARAGYHTALVGKLHLFPQRRRYGYEYMLRTESPNDRGDTGLQPVNDWVDDLKARGIEKPNNLGINANSRLARPWDLDERYHHTSWLADRAVDFLLKYRDPSCPYLLHLSFWAPHPPLIPPQAYWDRYYKRHRRAPVASQWMPHFTHAARGVPDDRGTGPFDPQELHDAVSGYYGLVHHVDDRIRYVLNRLFEYTSPRAKQPTLIIFTSDHGELLGDHHLWRKSLPYEGAAHVPLYITGRNLDLAPGRCDALVTLEDVAPTVLDFCGQPVPPELAGPLEGKSLRPLVQRHSAAVREQIVGECDGAGGNYFILHGAMKYIRFARTGEEQLFDLSTDPLEKRDLSGNVSLLGPFRERLGAYLAGREGGAALPAPVPCSNQPPRAIWGSTAAR